VKSFGQAGHFLARGFGLTPSGETRLLASEVRTGFKFIVLTGVAVEKKDRLRMFRFRHGVLPLAPGAKSTATAFRLSGAEAPASSVASASCYCFAENVRILPVVVTELKFIQVEREILLANVVVRPDDAPLEQRPKGFDIICVDVAANVFILGMFHAVVRESECAQVVIAGMLIGRNQRHAIT
jgi:hypothetical protein